MEIHKPKPVHNWRYFFKELGTIVLGILIAVGLEQTVEYFHWRHEVEVGRKAIVAEISANNEWYARRVAIAPCMDRMIGEARAVLASLQAGQKPQPFTVFHSGSGALLGTAEFDSERASQALTHFPRQELALMSRYYARVPQFTIWMDEESIGWSELSALKNPPAGLTASDVARLRGILDRVSRINLLILLNVRRNLKLTDRLGIARASPGPGQVEMFCKLRDDDQFGAARMRVETRP